MVIFIKKGIMLIAVLAFSISLAAQDKITFTWNAATASVNKSVTIQATQGKTFTINWGDGISEIKTGAGNIQYSHSYATAGEYTATITASNTDCRFITFSCISKQVTSLRLIGCSAIQELSCNGNQLTAIDVAGYSNLTWLRCEDNQISNLDLSGCSALNSLNCSNNQLVNLKLTACQALQTLDCPNNQLTNLDLSDCLALTDLGCTGNQLTSLNLSGYLNLRTLQCNDNQLTNLDLTGCSTLAYINCEDNQLTRLDLSDCSTSMYLSCLNNQLPLSELFVAHLLINDSFQKRLGTQSLPQTVIMQGGVVDYSSEVEFNGITTEFVIEKNGASAIVDEDYTNNNGIITFNTPGTYTVTMTNNGIVSYYFPAEVITKIIVERNDVSSIIEAKYSLPEIIGYYSIFGQKFSKEPTSGIYIIMYNNGKAKKVMK